MYCRKHICHKYKKLQIVFSSLAWRKQEFTGISAETPVIMFSGTVNAAKRLFMQQNTEIMTAGDLGHQTHQQQIVIIGQIGFLKIGASSNWLGATSL